MRVMGTARGDPDDPTRVVAHTEGTERPGALPAVPRVPHLPRQDEGRPGAAIDPPVPAQHDVREIAPHLSDELARAQMVSLYDEAAARGEVQLRDPSMRRDFLESVRHWSRRTGELSGTYHGAWMVGTGLIAATLGPAARTANPIAAPFFGAGLGNALWRTTQDSTSTNQAIQVSAAAANVGVQGASLAVGGALGAGQLALGAADLGVRGALGRGYTNPAAAVSGGGYALALPDAPGAATRGMGGMTADQFQDFLRQAHQTSGEAVRRAYMRGGMDMHGLCQQ